MNLFSEEAAQFRKGLQRSNSNLDQECSACGETPFTVWCRSARKTWEFENEDSNYEVPPEAFEQPDGKPHRGLVTYWAELDLPLIGQPVRVGEVLYMPFNDGQCFEPECHPAFERATLSLHANGIEIRSDSRTFSVAWSPFSLVQACRWHSPEADTACKWLRLFKVSVFHHGATHFFAVEGDGADQERARWVADIACTLRMLTLSLFPDFRIVTGPIRGLGWTNTRILAGYLLQCEQRGVRLVYCELHAHWDGTAVFGAYENAHCEMRTMKIEIETDTVVGERMAIDCSCFSLHGQHLAARTCSEKALWLRAISNIKVKLRHHASNPTPSELSYYRASVLESARNLVYPQEDVPRKPLLPLQLPLAEPPTAQQEEERISVSVETGTCRPVVQEDDADSHLPPCPDDDELATAVVTEATLINQLGGDLGGGNSAHLGSSVNQSGSGAFTEGSDGQPTVAETASLAGSELPPSEPWPLPLPGQEPKGHGDGVSDPARMRKIRKMRSL